MLYAGNLYFKNRLLEGHPISNIKVGPYNSKDKVRDMLEFLVEQVKPMNDMYTFSIIKLSLSQLEEVEDFSLNFD